MAERHYPAYPPGRAATYQPARATTPSTAGYNPVYPGDIHYHAAGTRHPTGGAPSSRYHHHTASSVSRGPPGTAPYPGTNDPLRRPRDPDPAPASATAPPLTSTRGRRSSTIDSTHPRPIIITTTQPSARPHGHGSSRPRSRSPSRPEYRTSSAIRSNSVSRQPPGSAQPLYSPTFDSNDEEYMSRFRGPDIVPASSRAEAYRNSRPTVVYPSNPRHSAIDLGDDYGYTKPGELLQYDLEHPKQSQPHRRHDSFDHYARPNIYYNPERRGFSIETNRTYEPAPGLGKSESRGGPPPTTWGLDKLNRSSTAYDLVPPPAPIPHQLFVTLRPQVHGSRESRESGGDQTGTLGLFHFIKRYRLGLRRTMISIAREMNLAAVESTGPESTGPMKIRVDTTSMTRFTWMGMFERAASVFGPRPTYLPNLTRGGSGAKGIVVGVNTSTQRLPLRRSDDDMDQDWDHIEKRELDDRHERRRSRQRPVVRDSEVPLPPPAQEGEPESGKRLRDNLKAGLGIAATAIGLGPMVNKEPKEGREAETRDKERRESPEKRDRERAARRASDELDRHGSSSDEVEIISARASDRRRAREKVYLPKERKERVDIPERSPAKDGRQDTGSPPLASEGSARAARGSPRYQKKLAALNVNGKQDKDKDKAVVMDPRRGVAVRPLLP
ncbi:unnamed protein product, partial [Parascedosporium putredinis]